MTTFKDLGLNPMILQALAEIGFESPTPIQTEAIPQVIDSEKDIIALASTGTGKTAAFSLPLIHKLNPHQREVQALILCPTRELATQITKDINDFIKYIHEYSVLAVYGGQQTSIQIKGLKKFPQIVVGTPGRVRDLANKNILKLGSVKCVVLDEADEMLNMGFKEELDEILENTPQEKQTLLFSATMNKQVRRIASNYMNKPDEITVGEKNQGADTVEHFYYVVKEKDRYQALRRIADMNPDIHSIVFCRTRRETQQVADKLMQDHYSADAIHGDISQDQRTHVMRKFKDKKLQFLVATDVAARGIDVDGLTHVINYNLPESPESYVHRSGRTGRAGQEGVSLLIVNTREKNKISRLENKIGKRFKKGKVPTGKDICERQLFNVIEQVCSIEINEEKISTYMDLINKKFEDMSREELIKRLVSVEFNRFIDHYKGSDDLNPSKHELETPHVAGNNMKFVEFKINVGRNDGLTVKELFTFIGQYPQLRKVEVGNISIKDNYTLFEIDEIFQATLIECFSNVEVGNKPLEIKVNKTGIVSKKKSFGGGSRNKKSRGSRKRRR